MVVAGATPGPRYRRFMTIHSRVRTTRLAVAALVTCAGAFTSGCTDTTTPEPADRASENTSPPSTPAASDSTATPGTTPGGTSSTDARPGPVGVYYGGATATGWRLFREFRAVPDDAESALAERLEDFPVRITQLAHGLPVGGELDYLDEGTLAQALRARRPLG